MWKLRSRSESAVAVVEVARELLSSRAQRRVGQHQAVPCGWWSNVSEGVHERFALPAQLTLMLAVVVGDSSQQVPERG